ncbi:MAG: hypothetical protein PVG84_07120, partial [Desulfobacterales bacterium]
MKKVVRCSRHKKNVQFTFIHPLHLQNIYFNELFVFLLIYSKFISHRLCRLKISDHRQRSPVASSGGPALSRGHRHTPSLVVADS